MSSGSPSDTGCPFSPLPPGHLSACVDSGQSGGSGISFSARRPCCWRDVWFPAIWSGDPLSLIIPNCLPAGTQSFSVPLLHVFVGQRLIDQRILGDSHHAASSQRARSAASSLSIRGEQDMLRDDA